MSSVLSSPLHRRWLRQGLLVLGLIVLSAVVAIVGGGDTTANAVSLAIFGIACVLGTVLVFYEVGRSEDRERASENAVEQPDDQGASRSTSQWPPSRR